MESTLEILNEMESAGLVKRHAMSPPVSGLLTLTPVYDFLKARGATERREHLLLAGTLLQVIPAYDALTEEAVQQSVERRVGQTPTRVMRVEHLIAIALKTGRAKDYARVALLLEEADVDTALLVDILQRHDLIEKWNQFKNAKQ